MIELKFSVTGQLLKRSNIETVVADSKNYLSAAFIFSEDWSEITKTAVFSHGENVFNVVLEDDKCIVPHEVIKESHFNVSVFGGDLITASEVRVDVMESGMEDGETPSEPTPDIYNQIVTTATEAKAIAQSVRDDANDGKLTPTVGENGNWFVNGVDTGFTSRGAVFQFWQLAAADTWSIPHNLNKYPSVTVVDSAGTTVFGDVHYESLNKLTVCFSVAFAGEAYLN